MSSETSTSERTSVITPTSGGTRIGMGLATRRIVMAAQTSSTPGPQYITPLQTWTWRPEMRRPNIRCRTKVRLRPGEKTSGNQSPPTPRKVGLKRDANVIASPNQLQIDAPPVLLPFLPPLPLLPLPRHHRVSQPIRDRKENTSSKQTERRRVGTRSQPRIVTCSSRHDNRDHKLEEEPGEREDSMNCGNKEITYSSTVIRWKELVSE